MFPYHNDTTWNEIFPTPYSHGYYGNINRYPLYDCVNSLFLYCMNNVFFWWRNTNEVWIHRKQVIQEWFLCTAMLSWLMPVFRWGFHLHIHMFDLYGVKSCFILVMFLNFFWLFSSWLTLRLYHLGSPYGYFIFADFPVISSWLTFLLYLAFSCYKTLITFIATESRYPTEFKLAINWQPQN